MPIRVVQLGSPRAAGEGLRLGTVRRPPRGVRKQDYARRDYFDVWLPELSPSAALVKSALSAPFTPARWARFARKYRQEMRAPGAQRLILLLAALRPRRTSLLGAIALTNPGATARCSARS